MNSYPLRWMHLQKGVSIENEVRGLLMRVGYRLSRERGVRANCYYPALDIDGVDIRLSLEAASGAWVINIDVAVRSSSRPAVILGKEDDYGTLKRWLKRCSERRTPCLLFQFDWLSRRLILLTPDEIRQLAEGRAAQSIPLPPHAVDVEIQLFDLLATIAAAPTEADARALLI